jgi:hypothetical protein
MIAPYPHPPTKQHCCAHNRLTAFRQSSDSPHTIDRQSSDSWQTAKPALGTCCPRSVQMSYYLLVGCCPARSCPRMATLNQHPRVYLFICPPPPQKRQYNEILDHCHPCRDGIMRQLICFAYGSNRQRHQPFTLTMRFLAHMGPTCLHDT